MNNVSASRMIKIFLRMMPAMMAAPTVTLITRCFTNPELANLRLYCKVYEVDLFDKASSCDELYFKKNVYFWGKYKMSNGLTVLCEYSRPKIYNAGTNPSYNQKTQKLARESLMMTDALSVDDPAAGVTVQYQVINI